MLERHIIPKLTQGEIDHLNRPISITEIQTIIILPEEKAPGPDFFTGELYQSFKKEMIPNLFSILQKRETEGTLPHSFFETRITPITKPEKDKKTTVRYIMGSCKNPNQNYSSLHPKMYRKNVLHNQLGLSQVFKAV